MIQLQHIHPIMVHFPIVLLLLVVAIDFFVLTRKNDLAAKQCLSSMGFYALSLAALAVISASIFGDIALDKAVELGFKKAPLEEHEMLGLTTLWIVLGLAGWQFLARKRQLRLAGTNGWVFFSITLIACGIMLSAAYHGGELVYHLGVNVAPVHP